MNQHQQIISERFIKYAKVNTRSDASKCCVPTTPNQVMFTLALAEELEQIGFSEIEYNPSNAYLTATIPSNVAEEVLTVGFIAHVDTADFNAENIRPQIHEHYDGRDVVLNEALGIVMRVAEFPQLENYRGQTLITTDGTTLLGADDKAGITSIITMGEYLLNHPEIPHGKIRVAFGPDEEIGARGAKNFDVDHFQANFAYTIDAGPVGKLTYDNFNACQIDVTIQGINVHPGYAKGTMVNALLVASRLAASLPEDEVPERTAGYEGYFFLTNQAGTVDQVTQSYYIRDHCPVKLQARIQLLLAKIAELNHELGAERITFTIIDQYRNMAEKIEEYPFVLAIAEQAYEEAGVAINRAPLRGGTDGAIISQMGLPTPNLFCGTENSHGKYEFVTVEAMATSIDVMLNILQITLEESASIEHYPVFGQKALVS